MNSVTKDFLATALWCDLDDEDDPLEDSYDLADFAPEALEKADSLVCDFLNNEDVAAWLSQAEEEHGYGGEQIGHDLWLTINGHGAGFWDRGLGEIGDKLTEFVKPYGEMSAYVGDDGQLYLFP